MVRSNSKQQKANILTLKYRLKKKLDKVSGNNSPCYFCQQPLVIDVKTTDGVTKQATVQCTNCGAPAVEFTMVGAPYTKIDAYAFYFDRLQEQPEKLLVPVVC